jgi:hypothetical protein
MVSILEPGKTPTLPASYRSINTLDAVGPLSEIIALAKVLREVNESSLPRDEQFGFRPGHSTALQLGRFVERVNEAST